MSIGWIKLHRSLTEWEWWDDHKATRLLVFLLCSVNREDKNWKGIHIEAGSMVLSWETLSNKVGLSIQECRTAMKKLEKSGEATRKTTNKYQLVTLCKWEKLQLSNKQSTDNLTDDQQATNSQSTTTKEGKEEKKDKNKEVFIFKRELLKFGFSPDLVEDWLKVRKSKKSRNTKTAFEGFIREVKLTGLDKNQVLRICTERSWAGLKAEWIKKITNNGNSKKSVEEGLQNF